MKKVSGRVVKNIGNAHVTIMNFKSTFNGCAKILCFFFNQAFPQPAEAVGVHLVY